MYVVRRMDSFKRVHSPNNELDIKILMHFQHSSHHSVVDYLNEILGKKSVHLVVEFFQDPETRKNGLEVPKRNGSVPN